MRMFIALPLPPDVQRALATVQGRLRACAVGGRYVPMGNFHITLHFIGESDDLLGAAAACDEAVRGIRPFVLRLSGYGSFARGETRTGYVAMEGELQELYKLHEVLVATLGQRGFPLGGGHRRLTPHITLARSLRHEGEVPIGMENACEGLGGGGAFTADCVILFKSESHQEQMAYTPLHRARILK